MKRLMTLGVVVAAAAMAILTFTGAANATTPPKPLPRVVVYVESQDLCYDSVVTAQNLPNKGPFQDLAPDPDAANHCGAGSLITEFGPGDVGYVGGRWDMGSGIRFMCPLLGPGYEPIT